MIPPGISGKRKHIMYMLQKMRYIYYKIDYLYNNWKTELLKEHALPLATHTNLHYAEDKISEDNWYLASYLSCFTLSTPPKNAITKYFGDRCLLAKLVPTFEDRGVSHGQCGRSPMAVISIFFLDQSHYFFFQVTPQLYSRGWVDPIPDPLLRKSNLDLWICNQELWPKEYEI
jgi:hypothetical protein